MNAIAKFLNYRRIINTYLYRHWIQYRLTQFLGVFLIISYNVAIFQMKPLMASITKGGDIFPSIMMISIILSLPLILEPTTFYFRRKVFSHFVTDLFQDIYNNVMNLDYKFHTDKETGKLVSKMLRIEDVGFLYVWDFDWHLINTVASFLLPIGILTYISWQVGLTALIMLILNLPIQIAALRFNIHKRAIVHQAEHNRNSLVIDTITNYETVRLFGRINEEQSQIKSVLYQYFLKTNAFQQSYGVLDFAARFSGLLIFTGSAIVAGLLYKNGTIDSSSLVVILSYLLALSAGTISLVYSFRQMFKALPVLEDSLELLNLKSRMTEPSNPRILKKPKGSVSFNNVDFKYTEDNENYAINKLSISIPVGNSIALVGPSGGGKSTLTKLLLRYYIPQSGAIKIDDIDINELGTSQINQVIGVVPQEPVLFNRSLKFNIGYAMSSDEKFIESNMDRIVEASKRAMIHDFIITLPKGYDTEVGERGIKLSGGQKQRIAIARVILKAPKIVIFDEATSQLDSESEGAIQKAFKELAKGTTTIIIAHRLSTIKNVDKIFVIDQGKLTEQGTHEELIKENGIYAKLWKMQSSGFEK